MTTQAELLARATARTRHQPFHPGWLLQLPGWAAWSRTATVCTRGDIRVYVDPDGRSVSITRAGTVEVDLCPLACSTDWFDQLRGPRS